MHGIGTRERLESEIRSIERDIDTNEGWVQCYRKQVEDGQRALLSRIEQGEALRAKLADFKAELAERE